MTTLKTWHFKTKLGSQLPTPSEVRLSRIMSPKKAVFRAFFLENHFFDPFCPNEDPQVLYMAGKLWISSFWWCKEKKYIFASCRACDFYTEKLSWCWLYAFADVYPDWIYFHKQGRTFIHKKVTAKYWNISQQWFFCRNKLKSKSILLWFNALPA